MGIEIIKLCGLILMVLLADFPYECCCRPLAFAATAALDPSGGVMLMTGSMDHGQGHGTTFKQVLSEKLGIDADLIRYRYGDSDLVTMGIGTFGSRSAQLAGSAIVVAA